MFILLVSQKADAFGFSATKIGGQDIGRQLQFVVV
jgi:hypothetical protein